MTLLTGGGTGGHLSIAKALCEAYNEKDVRPFYIGSTNGQDRKWFEGYPGFQKTLFLDTKGVVNQKFIGKFISLTNIVKSAFTCKEFMKQNGITKVITVGGYSAAPASFAALMSGIPLYIHEQNAATGRLNKLLRPFAKAFFSSYEEQSPVRDYPVSYKFFNNRRVKDELKTIIFLGGSQGATFINSLAKDIAVRLNDRGIKIIHQCGKHDYNDLKEFYEKNDLHVDLFDFSKNIHVKMQEAEFALSRAGAGSLWELCAACVPTLFIPYPYAASDHQYYNAKILKDKNVSFVKRQNEITPEYVLNLLEKIDIKEISKELKNIIHPHGANKIIDWIENGCS